MAINEFPETHEESMDPYQKNHSRMERRWRSPAGSRAILLCDLFAGPPAGDRNRYRRLFFQQEQVQAQVAGQISAVVGAEAAETVMGWLDATATREGGIIATVLGLVALLFGATGFFGQLQTSLNIMWEVEPNQVGASKGCYETACCLSS
jgi:hypothetical protein